MNCLHCGAPLPAGSRRDRNYCNNNCSALASYYRRKNGAPPPPRWQHPALTSDSSLLRAAAERARQLGEAHDWSRSTIRCAMDGLTVLLDGRPEGERVTLTEIRARSPRHASAPRVAEVLAGLGLLEDDTVPAVRSWISRRTGELPPGFAPAVRDWLLALLNGDARALRAWLGHRRATWPRTPNRHVLISEKTALGDGPVSRGYLAFHLQPRGPACR